jgi:PAS domain-containing protein
VNTDLEPASEQVRELQRRLDEALHTLDAIQNGSVDAVVVNGPRGAQIFTLESPDHPFRTFVEGMQEGALTLAGDGQILYANAFFTGLTGRRPSEVIGAELSEFVAPAHRGSVPLLVEQGLHGTVKHTLRLETPDTVRQRTGPDHAQPPRWRRLPQLLRGRRRSARARAGGARPGSARGGRGGQRRQGSLPGGAGSRAPVSAEHGARLGTDPGGTAGPRRHRAQGRQDHRAQRAGASPADQ